MRRPTSILLVTRNFPPLVGGMENVNDRLLRELSERWGVALCGPVGSRKHAPLATKVVESALNPIGLFLVATFFRAAWVSLRLRPRIVLAGSGLTLPIAWFAAKLVGARLGVYLHGLDIIAPSRIYQMFWPRFIRYCDLIMVNSSSTASLAIGKVVDPRRIEVLHPGTSIPVLDSDSRARFRALIDAGSEPILLSVGRLTKRKGLAEFVAQALPAILVAFPGTRLIIVGEEAVDALTGTGESERDRIIAAATASDTGHALKFVGRLTESELGDAYQAADIHVFPVLKMVGDVEGFGMVALESAAHGLRTVAFEVGGIPDAVQVPATGALVPSGDYRKFADVVISVLQTGPGSISGCRDFAKAKSWEVFGTRVRALVSTEMGDV